MLIAVNQSGSETREEWTVIDWEFTRASHERELLGKPSGKAPVQTASHEFHRPAFDGDDSS